MTAPAVFSSTAHDVTNQVPDRCGLDEYATNPALVEGVERHGAAWASERLHEAGRLVGGERFQRWAEDANRFEPELLTHDRRGVRLDEVRYHPSYHEVIGHAVRLGAHALPWQEPRRGAHVARAATFMLFTQVEPGHGCPISMTYSAVPALRAQPGLAATWEPRLRSSQYDPRLAAPAHKAGALCGMAMTEKQGGSDVRANTTVAHAVGHAGPGELYELVGHKWFCSAPMSDLFLVLAQTEGGLSCFAMPRTLDDGTRNGLRFLRLKDKLGNRSNASGELELEGAAARMVGEPGRGVATIIEMVNHTRLDCVLATTAGMRQAVVEALWHAAHRSAFGRPLIDQPLMRMVLADLLIEYEAALVAGLRLAAAYDAVDDPDEQLFKRLATAVIKYWVCKRGPAHAAEALECLGGNGYVETGPMPRRYREQPLTSIWEGSGNVMCLDVLRALEKTPGSRDAFLAELEHARGSHARLDASIDALRSALSAPRLEPAGARRLVEQMALVLQGALLVRFAPPALADAFCASRLAGDWGHAFGTLPTGVEIDAILARHGDASA